MPIARVNGVALHYELSGSGEPIVLVHGSWDDASSWRRVGPALSRSHRVLVYDRRGHTRSERPEGPGSLGEDAADLAALLVILDLAPAHVAANSLGGTIALRLAGEQPALFRSLTVHEPPLFALLERDPEALALTKRARAGMAAVVERLEAGDNEAGARLFVDDLTFGPGSWAGMSAGLRGMFVANAPTFLDESRDPEQLAIDLSPLRAFDRPVLLTHGSESKPHLVKPLDHVAQALPHARRLAFGGAGHVPHATHPDDYVSALTGFLTTGGRKPESGR